MLHSMNIVLVQERASAFMFDVVIAVADSNCNSITCGHLYNMFTLLILTCIYPDNDCGVFVFCASFY